jgi:RNA polymerase sigma factor (sigma-70 family)
MHRKRRFAGATENELASLPSPEADPASAAEDLQQRERLKAAMDVLPARQRLLLHFRFHDGLTLEKIAKVLSLGDTNRTWRHIQEALEALSELYQSEQSRNYRKK